MTLADIFARYSEEELQRPCIYRIYRREGDPHDEYVGQAAILKIRWAKHWRDFLADRNSRHVQRAWNAHGPDAFEWEVLEFLDAAIPVILDEREQWHITHRKPRYNLCLFVGKSRLGVKAGPETIAKMRLAQQNSRPPIEAILNSVAKRKGQRQKPGHVAKRSATMRLHGPTPKRLMFYESRRGVKTGPKPLSVRFKISQTKLGTHWSEARRLAQKPHVLSIRELGRLAAGQEYQRQRSRERDKKVFATISELGWGTHVPMGLMTAAKLLAQHIGFSKDSAYRALKRLLESHQITITYGQQRIALNPPVAPPFVPPSGLAQGTLFGDADPT